MNEKSKILIVEDDNDMIESIRKILEIKGYYTIIAFDPDEAGNKLLNEKPDVIILDVMFGNKGETKGFDFAYKIRNDKQFSDIPILMLTAINVKKPYFNFSVTTDEEYLPVDGFLDKPFQTDELISKVEKLLKQKTSKWKNWPEKE